MFFNPFPFMNFGEKYSHSIKQQQQHFLSSRGWETISSLLAVCSVLELQRVRGKHFRLQVSVSGIIDGPLFRVPAFLAFFGLLIS